MISDCHMLSGEYSYVLNEESQRRRAINNLDGILFHLSVSIKICTYMLKRLMSMCDLGSCDLRRPQFKYCSKTVDVCISQCVLLR